MPLTSSRFAIFDGHMREEVVGRTWIGPECSLDVFLNDLLRFLPVQSVIGNKHGRLATVLGLSIFANVNTSIREVRCTDLTKIVL